MELDNLLTPQAQPKQKTGWQHFRGILRLLILGGATMLSVFFARIFPFIAIAMALISVGGSLYLVGWAVITKGDQRAELMGSALAASLGVCLGLRDAWELLTVLDAKIWIAALIISVLMIIGFLSEGKANAK